MYLAPPIVELETGKVASLEVTAGRDLTLSASISGFNLPLTSISWRQQGSTLNGSEDRVTITNTPMLPASSGSVTSTLTLSATVPQDSGNYSVSATNGAGSDTLEFTVSVTGEDAIKVSNSYSTVAREFASCCPSAV